MKHCETADKFLFRFIAGYDQRGEVVKESLHLLIDGHETSNVDFGRVYHGRSRTIWARLMNDGPFAVPFQAINQKGDDEALQLSSRPK